MGQQYLLGVDPGLQGALALYNPAVDKIDHVMDVPVFWYGKPEKRHIDVAQLAQWLDTMAPYIGRAVIEQPGAMPGQGRSSMFRFGEACGILYGLVAAQFIPVVRVPPAKWKKDMKLDSDKDRVRAAASARWPQHAGFWSKKMHDGRAEAALLAFWLSIQKA